MGPAVGSRVVRSAVLITSDVSHCFDCVGRGQEKVGSASWLGADKHGRFGAVYQRGTLLRLPHGTLL